MYLTVHLRRATVMKFHCPQCKAKPSEPCMGSRKPRQPRKAPHLARYKVADNVLSKKPLAARSPPI